MSDLVAKLSADTSGFTPAVKKAKQALEEYSSIAGRAKRDSEGLTQDQIQGFNRLTNSLQRVGGAFRTTKQDIDTMKNVLRQLTAEYSRLDEKTRNTDYGKNLRGVIDSTSQKLNEMRQVQDNVNRSLDKGKDKTSALNSVLNQFSSKLGVSTGMLTKCGLATAGVSAALKVLSDAFMSTESRADDFRRMVSSLEGAYEGFLSSLESGDWSNFFKNINAAIDRAARLYNLLDRLDTVKGTNVASLAQLRAEIEKARRIINDPNSSKAEKDIAAKQVKEYEKQFEHLKTKESNAARKAGEGIIYNAIRNQLDKSTLGKNIGSGEINKVVKAFSTIKNGQPMGSDLFDAYIAQYQKYSGRVKEQYSLGRGYQYTGTRRDKFMYAIAKAVVDGEQDIREGLEKLAESANIMSETSRMESRWDKSANKVLGVPTTTKKTPKVEKEPLIEGTIAWYQEEIKKLNDEITKKTQVNDTQAITSLKRQRDEIEELLKTKNEMTDIIAKAQRGYATFDELLKLKDYKGNIVGNPLKESELDLIKGQKASDMSKFMDIPSLNATVKEQIEYIWLDAMQRALKKAVDQGGDWKSPYTQLYEYYQYRGNGDRDKWMSQMGSLRRNYLPQLILNGTSFKDLGETFNNSRILDTLSGMGLSMQSTKKPSRFNMEQYKSVLSILEQIKETSPIGSEDYEWAVELINKISEALKKLTETTFESRLPEWWDYLASAIGQTGNAIGGLTGKWISSMAQIATLTKQAIDLYHKQKQAKAAEAVANSVAESSKAPWIIQAAVIALNLASVIAALAKADKFAGGGIVSGTKLGDRNIAQVNGGEMILNTSEQGRLFRLLKGQGAIGNQASTATITSVKVSGSDLYLTLKNYMKNNKTKTL